jgi:hypothetical protein
MQILSRSQLLCLEAEELYGTMECHGYEFQPGKPLADQVDAFDEFLDFFRALHEEAS